ncbi:MAG: hypothetical protein ACD_16C00034G0002 [uncultured bacterium]|nr:MAG: hypothetical protein ACD_16C00034G0002 [uncultured bacterium]OFW68243.1 MAG: hypothetical protein A2X70_06355 [Alphaproteobacteria bacterium GWC2_42_16]OFW74734.1 MAG: hypothetical protein A2Z80_02625 [Alphaproteobacteria bacterium GWA2_41_27]OFW85036.1 MAG: hypothetical protein A3E50_05550 [Alphaproteobacteria bacterium RIFCSPHIGHO2_12_FULL_42_100]OFW85649.1 MAG: hypothetical protein A2W06_01765 [Alphaproteobacteria bacterium RBG_16_42_14]OFW92490.1 MAG: hypothetical protein A2W46_023
MKFSLNSMIVLGCAMTLLAGCGPKKVEEQQNTTKAQPTRTTNAVPPEEQETLKIEEENVFDEDPPG